ncbi:MmcQ/YjbR family DNA-binding protein [Actinoplanes sp. NPDC049316]|uniref:MmcQ/YjbR family DNA-binding protein n=1 Tax=Actinoplanes sp. NPDC049316 TaxID=3154727 RepID=UPI0034330706
MVTVQQVRTVALGLPRTTEHLIHDRVKFRVGKIVYVAFSRDESVMGFGYPREERQALVDSEPGVFHLPGASDMRFQWVQAWMAELDPARMEELVVDAWRMVVPKRVAAAYVPGLPDRE